MGAVSDHSNCYFSTSCFWHTPELTSGVGAGEEVGDHCFSTVLRAVIKLVTSHTLLISALLYELECICDERWGEVMEASKEQLCNVGGEDGGGREKSHVWRCLPPSSPALSSVSG